MAVIFAPYLLQQRPLITWTVSSPVVAAGIGVYRHGVHDAEPVQLLLALIIISCDMLHGRHLYAISFTTVEAGGSVAHLGSTGLLRPTRYCAIGSIHIFSVQYAEQQHLDAGIVKQTER